MSRNEKILSRLLITGPIDSSTPLIVIEEIADAHSIKYDKDQLLDPRYITNLLNTIQTTKVNMIKEPHKHNDYRNIARFVNRYEKWPQNVLNDAFNFLISFTQKENLRNLVFDNIGNLSEIIGLQTPEYPYRLNATVLYGMLKENRIQSDSNSTMEEMYYNLKLLVSLSQPKIIHDIRNYVHELLIYAECGGYQLVNILRMLNPDKAKTLMIDVYDSDDSYPYENPTPPFSDSPEAIVPNNFGIDYVSLTQVIRDIINRPVKTHPRTHLEAVAMAAIYYKMDISETQNPLVEYQEMTRTPYFPLDTRLIEKLRESNNHPESLNNPRLDILFNPKFPMETYQSEDLYQLCEDEGYGDLDYLEFEDDNPYTILQTNYFSTSFFHGKQTNINNINIENDQTTLFDEMDELEYDEVVIYGSRADAYFIGFTYVELYECFKSNKNFINPGSKNKELFSGTIIDKLSLLCKKDQRPEETFEMFQDRMLLFQEIERIKIYNQDKNNTIRDFINSYENSPENIQNDIELVLLKILNIGMYMRGWTGEGNYPLTSNQTIVESEQQIVVDHRVTKSLQELDTFLENNMNQNNSNLNDGSNERSWGETILNLPLIIYLNVSNEYSISTNIEEGLTVGERLNIVKGGVDGSPHSCIRLSSNRIISSMYYYLTLLKIEMSFNLKDMSYIT